MYSTFERELRVQGPPLRPGLGPIVAPAAVYDFDVLRTALRRCDLNAELSLLSETCRSICVHSCIVSQIKPKLVHLAHQSISPFSS